MSTPEPIFLCNSAEIEEGGLAMPFDVVVDGQALRAFAIRFEGQVHAWLNRCTHIAIEMDFQPNRLFDDSGQWLLCSTHGAAYAPDTGACSGGPCTGNLLRVDVKEEDGQVFWLPSQRVQSPF